MSTKRDKVIHLMEQYLNWDEATTIIRMETEFVDVQSLSREVIWKSLTPKSSRGYKLTYKLCNERQFKNKSHMSEFASALQVVLNEHNPLNDVQVRPSYQIDYQYGCPMTSIMVYVTDRQSKQNKVEEVWPSSDSSDDENVGNVVGALNTRLAILEARLGHV